MYEGPRFSLLRKRLSHKHNISDYRAKNIKSIPIESCTSSSIFYYISYPTFNFYKRWLKVGIVVNTLSEADHVNRLPCRAILY